MENFDPTVTEFVHISKVRIAVMWFKILQGDISLRRQLREAVGIFFYISEIRLALKYEE